MEIQFFQFFPANAGCTVEIAGIYHAAKKFSVLRVHQDLCVLNRVTCQLVND